MSQYYNNNPNHGNDSDNESVVSEGRDLASGTSEEQEIWLALDVFSADSCTHFECAYRTRLPVGHSPQPASLDRLNQHPVHNCRLFHRPCIVKVQGCSVHRGTLNFFQQCYWCERERFEGRYYLASHFQDCLDYPGDDVMYGPWISSIIRCPSRYNGFEFVG